MDVHKKFNKLTATLVLVSVLGSAYAATNATPDPLLNQPQANAQVTPINTITPSAPNLDAKAYVLMDANSGTIIAQKNMDKFILNLQSKVRLGNMSEELLKSMSLSWKNVGRVAVDSTKVPSVVLTHAFLLRPSVAPAKSVDSVSLDNGDKIVVVLNAIHNPSSKPTDKEIESLRMAMQQKDAANLLALYMRQQRKAAIK